MPQITIPKKITRGEPLVVIPQREWEAVQKIAKMRISEMEGEKELREALREVKEGKTIGPFDKLQDLVKGLENK